MAAVAEGRLTRRRIEASVAKILAAKEKVGLDRRRSVNLEAIADVLNPPEDQDRAQQIADRAVTLVRNGNNLVPLKAPEHACYVIAAEGRYSSEGQAFTRELRKRVTTAAETTLDPSMTVEAMSDTVRKLPACESYVVAAFSSAAAYRGTVGLAGGLPQLIQDLIASHKPVALVALGNPYLLRSFPDVTAYLATFSTVPPSETAAVRALLGELNIRGHLPVSIPGFAEYGAGFEVLAIRGTPAIAEDK